MSIHHIDVDAVRPGLLRLGHNVTQFSIDTLRRNEVLETLIEAKMPTDQIHVLPYRPGLTSDDIVAGAKAVLYR